MFGFNFNKEDDYLKIVNDTKSLLKEQIEYFRELSNNIDTKKLEDMKDQVDSPFMLLLFGEYNSGQSTFINSILGEELCKIGSTPTTDKINIIKNGQVAIEEMNNDFVNVIDGNVNVLKDFLIVDTPGTNSIVKEHQDITLAFIHRAELILFLTSADRPFSESEREMLELISNKYGKKIVFVLNKIDQKNEDELDDIVNFIEDNSIKLLGFRPTILKVSSKKAIEGIKTNNLDLTKESNIYNVVEEINKIYKKNALYLKLDSPLSTALKLLDDLEIQINKDSESIIGEVKDLNEFFSNTNQYREDLEKDYLKKVEIIQVEFTKIEHDMYDVIDSITFTKVLKSKIPFKKKKLNYNFEDKFTDLAKKINAILENLTYEAAQDNKKFYEQTDLFIKKQTEKYDRKDINVQTASSDYMDKLKQILDTLRKSFENDYNRLDIPEEGKNIKKAIDEGFTGSLIGGVASLGLGGFLIATLPTVMLDIVGLSISVVLTVSSLLILPKKKKNAKQMLSEKFKELSENLSNITLDKIKEDIKSVNDNIERNLKPYRSFINSQKDIIENNRAKTEHLRKSTTKIKDLVGSKYKKKKSGI